MNVALIMWVIGLCVLGIYATLEKGIFRYLIPFLERRGLTDNQVGVVIIVLIGSLGLLGAGAIVNYKMFNNVRTCEY